MFVDVFMMKDRINPFKPLQRKGVACEMKCSRSGVLSVYDGIKNVDQMIVFIT
jgi:hypothetical protein